MEKVIIRTATEADLTTLKKFLSPFIKKREILPRTLREIEELLPCFFIAKINGSIVGCAALEIYSRKLAEIRSLCVHEEYRNRGIGKQLVEKCLQKARKKRVLEVMVITASEQFFLSCGFGFTLPDQKKALFYRPS